MYLREARATVIEPIGSRVGSAPNGVLATTNAW